jgi:23S rRNA pseudouridine2457 synthase
VVKSGFQSSQELRLLHDRPVLTNPFGCCRSLRSQGDKAVLADYTDIPGVYCTGRLDYGSEGLLVLTDNGRLQQRTASPKYDKKKGYWVQIKGVPGKPDLNKLRKGILLKDGVTRLARVEVIAPPPSGRVLRQYLNA